MRFTALGAAAVSLLVLSSAAAFAADKIGSAVRIVNKVTGEIGASSLSDAALGRVVSVDWTPAVGCRRSGHP